MDRVEIMRERIELFADADRRSRLTAEELKYAPTIEAILEGLHGHA